MYEAWLVVPLSVLYGGLLTLALSEWVRQPHPRTLKHWGWLPIIVIFSLVGPLAYLLLGTEQSGRKERTGCS